MGFVVCAVYGIPRAQFPPDREQRSEQSSRITQTPDGPPSCAGLPFNFFA